MRPKKSVIGATLEYPINRRHFRRLLTLIFTLKAVVRVDRRESGGDDLDVGVAHGGGGVAVVSHGHQQRPQAVGDGATEVIADTVL